ncbi:MAG: hypothetical protein IPK52_22300 [Chloroflexi bacterium]|nr:hypothetical protein [Chloroflexota bacterium]
MRTPGATGDFDLSSPITIQGVTAATSIVDANFIDRAFDLHADAALTLMNATVRNGFTAGQGGAIAAEVAGTSVTATNVVFQGNNSQGAGGAASAVNGGTLVIQRSTFVDNLAPQGGALYFYDSGIAPSSTACSTTTARNMAARSRPISRPS